MGHIAQPGWLAVTLLVEPRLRIGRARMSRWIASRESALGVASRTILVFVAAIYFSVVTMTPNSELARFLLCIQILIGFL